MWIIICWRGVITICKEWVEKENPVRTPVMDSKWSENLKDNGTRKAQCCLTQNRGEPKEKLWKGQFYRKTKLSIGFDNEGSTELDRGILGHKPGSSWLNKWEMKEVNRQMPNAWSWCNSEDKDRAWLLQNAQNRSEMPIK